MMYMKFTKMEKEKFNMPPRVAHRTLFTKV